jgi:hypothetical protein
VLRLPLGPFFTTLLIGSFPFNFATVSIGNLSSVWEILIPKKTARETYVQNAIGEEGKEARKQEMRK